MKSTEYLQKCDLCGHDCFNLVFVKEEFTHVRCGNCGLVFVNPRLAGHLEYQQQSGTGSMGEESLSPAQEKRLARETAKLEAYRKLNRLLEIGPGKGWFLRQAMKDGWEVSAVEVNQDALNRLKALGIRRIIEQPAEDFEVCESFDVIRMWDVIEHLRSPKAAVSRIYDALRNGGTLRLSTTNFASLSRIVNGPEWVYLNGADHIFLFEPKTITTLLTSVGFDKIAIKTRSFNLRRKLYHPENVLSSRPIWLKPFRKIIDELIQFTNYGHQMLVTAQKP
jgi:2-polyprenyl-3-methyl-5-hydroxy-6-metoxy-1,4-benzoquinol methylase